MMTLGWHLNFYGKVKSASLCICMGKLLKIQFLKIISGWNLQCMIKVANPFSYDKNFVPQG